MNLTALIDAHTGQLTVEGDGAELFGQFLGDATEVNCARPLDYATLPPSTGSDLQVHALWFGSVVDGPGRRNVVQLQGCHLRCHGCYVPETHDFNAGTPMAVRDVLLPLMSGVHDGVTILGGEPFAQPRGLWKLVRALKTAGEHVCVYSGYTLETLRRRQDPYVALTLEFIDVLIDGAYVSRLGSSDLAYRGSTNQRIIDMREVQA